MSIQQGTFEDDWQFGVREFHGETTVHPLALASLVLLCTLTLALPRKYALLPCMVLVCFVPTSQRIVLLGLDFTLLRIIALVGCFRVLARGEFERGRWRRPDTLMLAWGAVAICAYALRHGSFSALIYMLGVVTEAFALYFMVRGLVRNWGDIRTFSAALVVICMIVAVAFVVEKLTGRNSFAVFGGVPAVTIVREGRLRCQGAFPHPILAGCFWAVMAAYMVSLWWSRLPGGKLAGAAGLLAAAVIIVTCASSTPVASLFAGAAAGACFVVRRYSRLLRYTAIAGLVGLHFVMQAPVWHLISRIDLAGGSTGYHRYLLLDATIRNFSEWALIGTRDTAHWGIQLFDLTNQFVLEGVNGGVLRLLLFCVLLWMCFSRVGLVWRSVGRDRERLALAWGLGVGLFIHCVSFFGVSYYGQVTFGLYFSIAAIVSIAEPLDLRRRAGAMRRLARGAAAA